MKAKQSILKFLFVIIILKNNPSKGYSISVKIL
jgi:hypothetical protein